MVCPTAALIVLPPCFAALSHAALCCTEPCHAVLRCVVAQEEEEEEEGGEEGAEGAEGAVRTGMDVEAGEEAQDDGIPVQVGGSTRGYSMWIFHV